MRKGIIVSSTRTREGNEYVLFDGETYHRFSSRERFRNGESVILGENGVERSKEDLRPAVKERFLSGLRPEIDLPEEISFLRENMEVLWKELAFLKITNERPLILFDGDADGIISALLIKEALGSKQYGRDERSVSHWALQNAHGLYPVDNPLVLFLDLGSDWNDRPGVCLASHFAPTFVVDHHFAEKTHSCATNINPALRSPELSKYNTATLVSYLVSSWVKKPEWVRIAAAGDKSSVVDWTKDDRKKALALEMAFSVNNTLSAARRVLETEDWRAFWDLFQMRVEMALEDAEMEEREIGEKRVLIVKLQRTPNYPHKGKIASYLMDERGYDVVIVADAEREKRYTVTLRGNIDFLSIVNEIGVKDYWGHPNAVSVSINDPDEVISKILAHL